MRFMLVLASVSVLLVSGCGVYVGDDLWVPSDGRDDWYLPGHYDPWGDDDSGDSGRWESPVDNSRDDPRPPSDDSTNTWQPPNDDPFDDEGGSNVPLSATSR